MNTELGHKPDLCGRCKNTKAVKRVYADDPDNRYGVQGPCDRCGRWLFNLWSMVKKGVLDRLAGI